MTTHIKIQGVIPRIQYVADGALATYTFPFAIFSADDIEVYLNDTKQTSTAYSVSGVRDSEGGTITFTTTPENGTIITIVRNLSIERTSDFQEGGALRADTLNDELDYQIACQQQIAENLNRSMVLPPYATDNNLDLTLPTPSAGKAIVWNSDGTNLENSTVAVNALESTLKGYKETAENAAATATTKAGIASDKADIATQKAQIATDKAEEAVTTLADKVNKDMDNISATGAKVVAELVMPSNSYEDLTLGSSGSYYTAPANGYVMLSRTATQLNGYISLDNRGTEGTSNMPISCNPGSIGQYIQAYVPTKKGDKVYYYYHNNTNANMFRFVYAKGEV